MNRTVYQERRTYQRYDETHIIGYLNEEELENYIPSDNTGSEDDEEPEPWPKAYAYTGSETDGGTVMECCRQDDYGEIANAIIRTRYTESQELAIQRHALNGDYEEAPQEYEQYNAWCQYAVQTAKMWIAARN
ncbi:hypothetical protein L6475_02075 [Prevotella sp. E9-3]|uniref:hypothetical protein n=1 Tax=Prevotella sp. E9-3 TaxID=2913621 RepID=UPI001EDC1F47|nr:hypothetical protein [Prevotella sp. E9-3]UKK48782.1 hypothetical protein L6475_02075 [Prevotella sp. E9-3]